MNKHPFQPWNFCPLYHKKYYKKCPDKNTTVRHNSKPNERERKEGRRKMKKRKEKEIEDGQHVH